MRVEQIRQIEFHQDELEVTNKVQTWRTPDKFLAAPIRQNPKVPTSHPISSPTYSQHSASYSANAVK
jgi:hypothetical protein